MSPRRNNVDRSEAEVNIVSEGRNFTKVRIRHLTHTLGLTINCTTIILTIFIKFLVVYYEHINSAQSAMIVLSVVL